MVLTKEELISSLRHEVRILMHLAGKADKSKLDYRPTPKQRSTLELLRYLAIMGPAVIAVIKGGAFNRPALSAAWEPAIAASAQMNFGQAMAAIQTLSDEYVRLLAGWTEADFRGEADMFGNHKTTRGYLLVNLVVGGHAAYEELNTMNLWAGADAMM